MSERSPLDRGVKDLHVFLDSHQNCLLFGVVSHDRIVHIELPGAAIHACFGVSGRGHALLIAYDAHRLQIDAAVLQKARSASTDTEVIGVEDLLAVAEHGCPTVPS